MKKNLYLLVALAVIVLSSCKNEDISISRKVSFNVNPYTVVKDFAKHEMYPGDLSSVYYYDLGDRLRVQLFVYNTQGNLVKSAVKYLDGYSNTMNATLELSDGSYNVIAITDEVGLVNGNVQDEYWFITGTERLSNLKIASNRDWKEFGLIKKLGITKKAIVVKSGSTTVNIDVEPAGAMMQSWIYNVHGFTDVLEYSLWMDKANCNFTFNSSGNYEVGFDQTSFSTNLRATVPSEFTAGNIYAYHFFIPFGNTGFQWIVKLEDENYYYLLDELYCNIKAGRSYNAVLDIDGNNTSFTISELGNSKAMAPTGTCEQQILPKDKSYYRTEHVKPEVVSKLER